MYSSRTSGRGWGLLPIYLGGRSVVPLWSGCSDNYIFAYDWVYEGLFFNNWVLIKFRIDISLGCGLKYAPQFVCKGISVWMPYICVVFIKHLVAIAIFDFRSTWKTQTWYTIIQWSFLNINHNNLQKHSILFWYSPTTKHGMYIFGSGYSTGPGWIVCGLFDRQSGRTARSILGRLFNRTLN